MYKWLIDLRFKTVALLTFFLSTLVFLPVFFDTSHGVWGADRNIPREPSSPAAQTGGPQENSLPPATHAGQAALVLLSLVVILMGAKLGGDFLERFRQPAVLGELLFGVILGNLSILSLHGMDYLKTNEVISTLAEIGVIFLLFEVGLESNIKDMMEVGMSSFLVATVGVICPMILGWWISSFFLPESGTLVHVFIGATLCATSVGITARVLKDLGRSNEKEARIILGAAVIDDVMGLVVLAAVSGIIKASDRGTFGVAPIEIGIIFLKATIFFVASIWLGSKIAPQMFRLASLLRIRGMLLITSISFCFFLSYLASLIDLAPIVGAFAAGLILDPVHYQDLRRRENNGIEELIHPIVSFLVPIFFVLMGVRVDLRTFADPSILTFAMILTAVAVVGKQACSLGVLEKGLDRLSVGIGMIPRGEVGLIFASIGSTLLLKGKPVIINSTYSAVVIMVILTTLVTPPVLKLSLERGEKIKRKKGIQ